LPFDHLNAYTAAVGSPPVHRTGRLEAAGLSGGFLSVAFRREAAKRAAGR
jgi:hypothetical protein